MYAQRHNELALTIDLAACDAKSLGRDLDLERPVRLATVADDLIGLRNQLSDWWESGADGSGKKFGSFAFGLNGPLVVCVVCLGGELGEGSTGGSDCELWGSTWGVRS